MMMKSVKNSDEQLSEYTLNLDSVSDDGSFKCPNCGISISPDDETEENSREVERSPYSHTKFWIQKS